MIICIHNRIYQHPPDLSNLKKPKLTYNSEDSFFQRKAIQRHISMESLPELKKELFNNAQVLLEDIDKVMAEFDSGRDLDKKSDRTYTTGIGVYYFEEEN